MLKKKVIDGITNGRYYKKMKGVSRMPFSQNILNHPVQNSNKEQVNMLNNSDKKVFMLIANYYLLRYNITYQQETKREQSEHLVSPNELTRKQSFRVL